MTRSYKKRYLFRGNDKTFENYYNTRTKHRRVKKQKAETFISLGFFISAFAFP